MHATAIELLSLKERALALACTVVMSTDVAASVVVPDLLKSEINPYPTNVENRVSS